jgi:hypothetical protein
MNYTVPNRLTQYLDQFNDEDTPEYGEIRLKFNNPYPDDERVATIPNNQTVISIYVIASTYDTEETKMFNGPSMSIDSAYYLDKLPKSHKAIVIDHDAHNEVLSQ